MKLCECGCEQIVNPGKRYIWGHNQRGVIRTEEAKRKIGLVSSISMIGNQNAKGHKLTKKTKRIISQKMSGKNNPNYKDGRTLRKYYCIDCGKEISIEAKRCHSCNSKINTKKQWENGKMDGVFKSPTKPEKKIMEILEKLGIDYIFQYKPRGYSKPYDFYVPEMNLLIEYDSKFWHKNTQKRDAEKTNYANNNGYNLLRINE